jgi:small subunit ribosomal protein S6
VDAPAPALHELERQTRVNEDIIRFMTIRVDAHEKGPSVMMRKQERSERSERGGFGDRPDRGPRPDRAPRAEEEI